MGAIPVILFFPRLLVCDGFHFLRICAGWIFSPPLDLLFTFNSQAKARCFFSFPLWCQSRWAERPPPRLVCLQRREQADQTAGAGWVPPRTGSLIPGIRRSNTNNAARLMARGTIWGHLNRIPDDQHASGVLAPQPARQVLTGTAYFVRRVLGSPPRRNCV